MMKITALLHDCSADGESGFAASCIEFPEANAQGETVEECLDDLRSAVQTVLECRLFGLLTPRFISASG